MLAGNSRKNIMCEGSKSLADVLGNCIFKSFYIKKKKQLEFVELLKRLGYVSCGPVKPVIVLSFNRCAATLLMDGPALPVLLHSYKL